MSEEEKHAIRNLENLSEFGLSATLNQTDLDKMKIVLNLIEKQRKEIQELKTEKQLLEFQEKQLENYIEELKKHDYRNIKIDEENKIKSPSFTKEMLDLMNLGIALYLGIPKLLEDESEDIDI